MKSKTLFIGALLVLCSPSFALAFTPDNGQVTRLTDDVWLYVNTAEYGSSDGEVTIPIATAPSWMPRISRETYLRYRVRIGDRGIAGLDTKAIVLSNAPVVDNQYVVPANESYSFTFIALVRIPDLVPPDQHIDLSLEVTSGMSQDPLGSATFKITSSPKVTLSTTTK